MTPHGRRTGWTRMRERRGVALPLALLGLVAVSLMITAMLLTSATEGAISLAQQDATRDLYRAQGALERYVAENANNFGATDPAGITYAPSGMEPTRITVSQLSQRLVSTEPEIRARSFAVIAEPLRNGTPGGRAVGAMVEDRFQTANLSANITGAATITSKEVKIGGSSYISGKTDGRLCNGQTTANDTTVRADTVNAVVLADSGTQNVDIKASSIDGGMIAVHHDTRSREQLAAYVLGGLTPAQMARYASIKFGFDGKPAWSGGQPNSSKPHTDPLNWGCPRELYRVFDSGNACAADGDENRYPVVAIKPDLTGSVDISGDHGQGMLIVLGDLNVRGKFFYSGIVIVTGKTFIRGSGGEARIDGALVSLGDVNLCGKDSNGLDLCNPASTSGDGSTDVLGNAKVMYNTCSVAAAQKAFNTLVDQGPQLGSLAEKTFAWFEVVR